MRIFGQWKLDPKFFPLFQISSANSHHVWVNLLLQVCIFNYELHNKQVSHLYDKWKPSALSSTCCHYLGTKIHGTRINWKCYFPHQKKNTYYQQLSYIHLAYFVYILYTIVLHSHFLIFVSKIQDMLHRYN